ncbi:MAG: glycosyltransferase family 4 protein [Alphaproteobacteria bacterium]|nr:glycosyltransferase family 4 protein [Alphaproteobacteria bacterium]
MKICALGAATSAHVVARAKVFADFGHAVTLITPAPGDAQGLPVVTCARQGRGRLGWLKAVFGAVKAARADVYHAHYAAELTTWMAWLLGKRPLVITVMGGDVLFDEQGSLGPIGRWLTRRAVLGADLVTVKSPMLGEVVARWGVARERILDVVWGVDARLFRPDPDGAARRRAEWGVSVDDRVAFSPRMLKPLYNQMVMVEALARVPGVTLVISTYNEDAAYRAKVEDKVQALGVADRVIFVPAVSTAEMAASYSAADVVLSLPPSDGTPQSVMEAMACGAPVVLTDLERFKALFTHGETAWFAKPEPGAVAGAVMALLNDAELCARLSGRGMALVRDKADFETQARLVEARMKALVR